MRSMRNSNIAIAIRFATLTSMFCAKISEKVCALNIVNCKMECEFDNKRRGTDHTREMIQCFLLFLRPHGIRPARMQSTMEKGGFLQSAGHSAIPALLHLPSPARCRLHSVICLTHTEWTMTAVAARRVASTCRCRDIARHISAISRRIASRVPAS